MKHTLYNCSFLILFFLLMYFSGCIDDPKSKMSEEEIIYFEDYTSPKQKWGFINKQGKIVVNPKYDDLRDASSELIAANLNGKWGYIDSNGNNVIPHIYKQALDFSNNRSFVQNFNNNWILINQQGDSITQLKYSNFKPFRGKYCVVELGNKYSIINNHGAEVLQPMYENLKFIDSTKLIAKQFGKYGIINVTGQILLQFDYDLIYPLDNGFLKCKQHDQFIYIKMDFKNKSSTYDEAYNFYAHKALIKKENKYLLIDTNFVALKSLTYQNVQPILNGYFKYKKDGLYGILNPEGEILVPPKYNLLNNISCDRMVFSVHDNFGYLDISGQEIMPPILPLAWDYKDNMARIITRNGMGFIDHYGKMIIDDRFRELRDFNNGLARFQSFR